MITIQVLAQWPDNIIKTRYKSRLTPEMEILKQCNYILIVCDISKLGAKERTEILGMNNGIYAGANHKQFVRFCDGRKILKEWKLNYRPEKEQLLNILPDLQIWLEYYKSISVLDALD